MLRLLLLRYMPAIVGIGDRTLLTQPLALNLNRFLLGPNTIRNRSVIRLPTLPWGRFITLHQNGKRGITLALIGIDRGSAHEDGPTGPRSELICPAPPGLPRRKDGER